MALYYLPPSPNIGGQQPLTPAQLTPPSGPAPSNPVFGAVSLVATLVAAWSAVAAPLPQQSANFIPPPAASAPPPTRSGTPPEIVANWLPAAPMPPAAINLDPPIAGPTPQSPPIRGAANIPAAVLVQWLPPPPQPPSAINLDPPQAGPTPQAPPLNGGASVPRATLVQWLPPPPAPPAAVNLDPPLSGPLPQPPPVNGGARVPSPVLVHWIPPAPQPPAAVNSDPPRAGPAPQNPPRLVRPSLDAAWSIGLYALPQRTSLGIILSPAPASNPPPSLAGVVAIQVWWARPDPGLPQLPLQIAATGGVVPPVKHARGSLWGMLHTAPPAAPGVPIWRN